MAKHLQEVGVAKAKQDSVPKEDSEDDSLVRPKWSLLTSAGC